MATVTNKSLAMMRTLKERLKWRMPSTYVFTDGADGSGNPALLVSQDSTPAAGEQVVCIRIQPMTQSFSNAVGGTQEAMAPHFVDLCMELSDSATATTSVILSAANVSNIIFETTRLYGITRVYATANATVPALANIATQMVAGGLKTTISPEWQAGPTSAA